MSAGNAGNGIMRWDGSAFHPVGDGLQGENNNNQQLVGAGELEVHDGKLWACGSFSFAGHVPTPGIASWDGVRWCGLPPGPNLHVNAIEFFHDTLFVAPYVLLYGVDVNSAAKFVGTSYTDSCSAAVGVEEPRDGASAIHIWPNPTSDVIHMNNPRSGRVSITDATGRQVMAASLPANGTLDVSALASGCYMLRLRNAQHQLSGAARFLKE